MRRILKRLNCERIGPVCGNDLTSARQQKKITVWISFSIFSSHPTNPFTILEHQDQEIGKFYVVQKRLTTDFEAPILWKGSSERQDHSQFYSPRKAVDNMFNPSFWHIQKRSTLVWVGMSRVTANITAIKQNSMVFSIDIQLKTHVSFNHMYYRV